jgi:hypothetical protein
MLSAVVLPVCVSHDGHELGVGSPSVLRLGPAQVPQRARRATAEQKLIERPHSEIGVRRHPWWPAAGRSRLKGRIPGPLCLLPIEIWWRQAWEKRGFIQQIGELSHFSEIVIGELHSRFWSSQLDDDTFLISQLNATHTAEQGTTASNRTVSAGKVA